MTNYNKRDINAQDEYGNTRLHLIVKNKRFLTQAEIENILRQHPNPFIKNNNGMTPRLLAELLGYTSHASTLAAYESSYKEDLDRKRFELIGNLVEILPNITTSKFVTQTPDEQKFAMLKRQLQQINQHS